MVAAAFVMTEMAEAIKSAYGVAKEINAFIDEHIDALKASANEMISRVGRVLEGAKTGFGIGWLVPMVIIAAGQLLLGNPLAAGVTVITTLTFTNTSGMTCAAVGAIYFGWAALNDDERNAIIDRLPNDSLVAVLVSKLDDNLLEDWEERASIMQFDALLPKGYAECLAMLDLLCRHPEVLTNIAIVAMQIELDGQTQWIATTDLNHARQHLADIHATEIAVLDLRTAIEEQYSGTAMLTFLG